MEKIIKQLQNEIEMLRLSIAEEQRQKYDAYVRIEALNKELNEYRKLDEWI